MRLLADRLEIAGLVVRREVVPHLLLGEANLIEHEGRTLTAMSAIDWNCPTRIPTVAEPRKLPPGAGSAVLNAIALLAQRAGVNALRYAGPYPTPLLYEVLLRSFRTVEDRDTFSADLMSRIARLARDEVPVDFAPAPFERIANAHGYVEIRDGLERTTIDGVSYDHDGSFFSHTRLIEHGDGWLAAITYGARVFTIAELDRNGMILSGPFPPPVVASDVIGKELPLALRRELADCMHDMVPSFGRLQTAGPIRAVPNSMWSLGKDESA